MGASFPTAATTTESPRIGRAAAGRALRRLLRDARLRPWAFRPQHPVGPFVAEFACVEAGVVVETHGEEATDPDVVTADARRATYFHLQGFTTLRFSHRACITEPDAVLASIAGWLADHHPSSGHHP